MIKKAFKSWTEHFRGSRFKWLLVNKHGKYEFRNPDSVYIHNYVTFASKEDAIHYLKNNIAPVDYSEWALFQEVEIL